MRRKYIMALTIVLMVLAIALVSVGTVKADESVSGTITAYLHGTTTVIPSGDPVAKGTEIDLKCTYTVTNQSSGYVLLEMAYDASAWPTSGFSALYTDAAWPNGATYTHTITLDQTGYYVFKWTVCFEDPLKGVFTHTDVQTTESPPVPEPATIVGLGIALVAVAAVLMRKRSAKH